MTRYVLTLRFLHEEPTIHTFETSQSLSELYEYTRCIGSCSEPNPPKLVFGEYEVRPSNCYDYDLLTLDEWFEANLMRKSVV